jgi:hypothetical protein
MLPISSLLSTMILLPVWMTFVLAASEQVLAASAIDRTLRFTTNGSFQITVFNDLHFGEAENQDWGPRQVCGISHSTPQCSISQSLAIKIQQRA